MNNRTCPRISRKIETACPFQVRFNSTDRRKRLPNAVGLGTHKSGTGALAFLDCHPNLVLRALEANAFPNRDGEKAQKLTKMVDLKSFRHFFQKIFKTYFINVEQKNEQTKNY